MDRKTNYSLLLLAGGKSSRMGRDKALLLLNGKTFIDHLVAAARQLGIEQIFLSGHEQEGAGIHTVWDEYPDRGPLGGMHACMKAMETPYCLVLPVDVPQISAKLLSELICSHEKGDGRRPLIWRHGARSEPLIGVYPTAMADTVEHFIEERAVPVFRVLDNWGYECFNMEVDEEQYLNINTPENYAKLLQIAESAEI